MTPQEMKNWVKTRIDAITHSRVNAELPNTNGLLLNFIPLELGDTNPIVWNERDIQNKSKRCFRRFTDLETTYTPNADHLLGYTPHREYFALFQNGITEVYKHPIVRQNWLARDADYIKTENLFYSISSFLEASKCIHTNVYRSTPPYYLFITLIGVRGIYFMSIDKNYVITEPFQHENAKFEPFFIDDFNQNHMPEIAAEIHYGIRASGVWSTLE